MANYRPKSLDELNSFYDKKLSSENVIEDTASSISTEAFTEAPAFSSQTIDDFFAEQTPIITGQYGDLTEDINRFIANFGKPATKEDEYEIRHRPVPIKLRQTPTQPKPVRFTPETGRTPPQQTETAVKPVAEPKPVQQEAPAPAEAKPEKTELVITAEKNELFEEYMRIMSDEDDDAEYTRSRGSRKRKKNKKAAESTVHTKPAEEASVEEAPEAIVLPLPEAEEETESFVSFALEEEKEPVKEEETEAAPSKEADTALFFPEEEYDEDNGEEDDEEQPRKKSVTQLLLFLLLFVTLITALAVTALQTVVKVNSGELFADKYYAYTADFTDKVADINEGELIIIENVATQNGQVFAYTTPDGISYAVQTFSGEPERTSGKNAASDSIVVLNTSIKGTVVRCFASLGKIAALISENFMTVIVSLLVLAVFIILLLIFSFRKVADKSKDSSKDNFSFDDEEDYDEASDEDFSSSES